MNSNRKNGKNGRIMKSTHWIRPFLAALLISLLAVSVAVAASKLSQPKADGLIGEQSNGYLGLVVSNAPANIRKLVEETNASARPATRKLQPNRAPACPMSRKSVVTPPLRRHSGVTIFGTQAEPGVKSSQSPSP